MATASSTEIITNSARQAYWVLRIAFTIVPIIAGIDQFTDKLANYGMYLAPLATCILPIPAHGIMIAGATEIIAGSIVAFAPRIGGWIVAIWLGLIIINLLVAAGLYDNAPARLWAFARRSCLGSAWRRIPPKAARPGRNPEAGAMSPLTYGL